MEDSYSNNMTILMKIHFTNIWNTYTINFKDIIYS